MKLLTLKEYAKKHNVHIATVQQKIKRGNLPEAQKMGRIWLIPEDAKYIDNRLTSGKYVGWKRKTKRKPGNV